MLGKQTFPYQLLSKYKAAQVAVYLLLTFG